MAKKIAATGVIRLTETEVRTILEVLVDKFPEKSYREISKISDERWKKNRGQTETYTNYNPKTYCYMSDKAFFRIFQGFTHQKSATALYNLSDGDTRLKFLKRFISQKRPRSGATPAQDLACLVRSR